MTFARILTALGVAALLATAAAPAARAEGQHGKEAREKVAASAYHHRFVPRHHRVRHHRR